MCATYARKWKVESGGNGKQNAINVIYINTHVLFSASLRVSADTMLHGLHLAKRYGMECHQIDWWHQFVSSGKAKSKYNYRKIMGHRDKDPIFFCRYFPWFVYFVFSFAVTCCGRCCVCNCGVVMVVAVAGCSFFGQYFRFGYYFLVYFAVSCNKYWVSYTPTHP